MASGTTRCSLDEVDNFISIKVLRLDIQCQRGASVKIGWKYLDD